MKKKIVSVLMAGAMIASVLAGCGSETSGDVSTDGVSTTDSTGTVESSGSDAYNVATVRWSDWGEDYHTGFPDEAAAAAGIKVNWDTIVNADWSDKKAIYLAGGDLPDAFMGSICFSESDIMTNQGTFIALDDYIDQYMPNFKKIYDSDPTMKALATAADGHIYGLPSKKPCRPTIANQMFINKTWLDNLGLEVPQTYQEFEEVLKAFKEKDANGNGDPNDEIPYGRGMADSVMFFCLPFGTTLGADGTYQMTLKDGEPVFLPTSDEYKAGIEWMNQCYQEGLIDPEIFTEDDSMRDAKLQGETALVGCAAGWTADAIFGSNSDQYIALPALEGPDGERYVSSDPEHWNYSRDEFVVTADCKNPGPLLSWIDQFYTDDASIQNFYGSFGKAIEKDDAQGIYKVLEPNDGNSADTFAWINSLRDFGPKYVADGFNDKVSYAGTNGDAVKLKLDTEMAQYAKEAYPNVSYTVDQLNQLTTLYPDISSYVSSMQSAWVTEGGVNDQWDDYKNQLNAMGYENFMKIMNDAFTTYQASK